jgi:hypothetical protein
MGQAGGEEGVEDDGDQFDMRRAHRTYVEGGVRARTHRRTVSRHVRRNARGGIRTRSGSRGGRQVRRVAGDTVEGHRGTGQGVHGIGGEVQAEAVQSGAFRCGDTGPYREVREVGTVRGRIAGARDGRCMHGEYGGVHGHGRWGEGRAVARGRERGQRRGDFGKWEVHDGAGRGIRGREGGGD